jgi:hypothetical protein
MDLRQHPMGNALTNVVGGRRTEVHVVEEALAGGELLVLSTDGVHDVWMRIGSNGSCSKAAIFVKSRPAWSVLPWPVAAAITAQPSSRAIFPIERSRRWDRLDVLRRVPVFLGLPRSFSGGSGVPG